MQSEVNDIHRQRERQLSEENFFDDLSKEKILELSIEMMLMPDVLFSARELQVPIYDEILANALEQQIQHK